MPAYVLFQGLFLGLLLLLRVDTETAGRHTTIGWYVLEYRLWLNIQPYHRSAYERGQKRSPAAAP